MLSGIEYILSKKTEGIDRTPLALSFVELLVYVKLPILTREVVEVVHPRNLSRGHRSAEHVTCIRGPPQY